MSQIITQLLSAIKDGNVDRFSIALVIALAQQPPIDFNEIHQNGHTILTFAALHYNPAIISQVLREPSVNVKQINAFGQPFIQVANQIGIPEATLKYLIKSAEHPFAQSSKDSQVVIREEDNRVSHIGERLHKCDKCGKTFNRLSHFYHHKRIHSEKRPFKCDECGKKFKQGGHLDCHKSVHTGDRPFKCDMCGNAFTQSNHLACHKRIHTGDRPFECNECDKKFSHSSNLTRHKQVHLSAELLKCAICGKKFNNREGLKLHHKSYHPGNERRLLLIEQEILDDVIVAENCKIQLEKKRHAANRHLI